MDLGAVDGGAVDWRWLSFGGGEYYYYLQTKRAKSGPMGKRPKEEKEVFPWRDERGKELGGLERKR